MAPDSLVKAYQRQLGLETEARKLVTVLGLILEDGVRVKIDSALGRERVFSLLSQPFFGYLPTERNQHVFVVLVLCNHGSHAHW